MAVWFGLVTGALDAIIILVAYLLHRCLLDFYSPIIWTIPLSDAAVLAVPGFVFFLCARRVVSPRLRKIALFLFCTIAVSATLGSLCSVLVVMLWPPAVILLSAGIASQVVRFYGNRMPILHNLFVRTTPVLIAVPLLCGLLTKGRDLWSEQRSLKSLPAAQAGAPNVLLVVLDTVRARSMSLYGNARETTPNLKRWAERGVVFEQAIAPSPFTLTSHASMFTGRYAHQVSADWTIPLESGFPTLAEVLHDRGYVTGGFVANTYSAGGQTGLDRGFGRYLAHRLTPLEILVSSTLCRNVLKVPRHTPPAAAVNDYFANWLTRLPRRPFFAFLNYCDCHVPYTPEPEFETASHEEQLQVIFWGIEGLGASRPDLEPAHLALALNAYEACLQGLDRRINELLKKLETRGDLKNTIVIIAGDHGEQFGEHNMIQHADSLYRPALHVPLLILAPNTSAAGQRVRQMVTLRDLPATILDLLNIPQGSLPGDSFAAAVKTGPSATLPASPKFAFIGRGINFPAWHPNSGSDVSAVFLDGKYLIHNARQEELYDFQTDPEEKTNLVSSGASRALLDHLQPLLPARASK
jgi:arylsulfatase A-like enzyme